MRIGDPAFRAKDFRRFIDRLMLHGLEAVNLYYGIYRAQVVDRSDPDGMGIIKIRCPAVGDRPGVEREAYPVVPFAGDDQGFKNLPSAGSYVWVVFERGKLDIPVWLGSWWAEGEMPSDLSSPDARGWVTPAGHQILLVDDAGQEVVRVKHKSGAVLDVDPDGNVVLANGDPATPGSDTSVSVGKDADEAAAKADTLKGLLEELIDAIGNLTVVSPAGSTSTPVNAATFVDIKSRLGEFLSEVVKVA